MDDFLEEFADFWQELLEDLHLFKHKKKPPLREVDVYGQTQFLRPAFIFAEKVENVLKIVAGVSIVISGIMATFWGFTGTGEILKALINSSLGRILIVIIGSSYFIIGLWKLLNLNKKKIVKPEKKFDT